MAANCSRLIFLHFKSILANSKLGKWSCLKILPRFKVNPGSKTSQIFNSSFPNSTCLVKFCLFKSSSWGMGKSRKRSKSRFLYKTTKKLFGCKFFSKLANFWQIFLKSNSWSFSASSSKFWYKALIICADVIWLHCEHCQSLSIFIGSL